MLFINCEVLNKHKVLYCNRFLIFLFRKNLSLVVYTENRWSLLTCIKRGGRPHGPPQNEVAQTTTCFALPCTGGYGALCDWAKTTQWHFSWLLHSCEWSVTRSHPENKKFQYFTEFQLAFLFHYNPNDLPLSCRER